MDKKKTTTRPPTVWPEMWTMLSKNQRKQLIDDWDSKVESVKVARIALRKAIAEETGKSLANAGGDLGADEATASSNTAPAPAMPVVPVDEAHREKIVRDRKSTRLNSSHT